MSPFPAAMPFMNDVVVNGDYAYVATTDVVNGSGLLVFDVSDRTDPYVVSLGLQAALAGSTRIVRQGANVYGSTADGISSLDIADPLNVFEQDSLAAVWTAKANTMKIDADASYAYVFTIDAGLRIFDTADPTNLVEVTGHGFDPASPGWTTHITYGCSDLYPLGGGGDVACCRFGNWIANPCHAEYPSYSTPLTYYYSGGLYGKVTDSAVYITDGPIWKLTGNPVAGYTTSVIWGCTAGPGGSGQIASFDISGSSIHAHSQLQSGDPYHYQILTGTNQMTHNAIMTNGSPSLNNTQATLHTDGNFYVLRNGGISIMVQGGAEIYSWTVPTTGFALVGNYAYILYYQIGNHRLEIYDISTPTSPVLVGTGRY